MSNLQPGSYSLRLAASPSPLVGVLLRGVFSQPVRTRPGMFKTWNVTKDVNEDYILSINVERDLVARVEDKNVFAVLGVPTAWIIDGPEGGPYTIKAPGHAISPLVWTVEIPDDPESRVVVLRELQRNREVPENQKWYFIESQ